MLSVSRKRFANRHKAVCDWGAALQRAAAPYFGLLLTDPWLGSTPDTVWEILPGKTPASSRVVLGGAGGVVPRSHRQVGPLHHPSLYVDLVSIASIGVKIAQGRGV
jgi:hypothetical protein